MIAYFDTSAFVPLMIAEPGSAACARFWTMSESPVATRLLHVETSSSLARAHRSGRLTAANYEAALELRNHLWRELDIVELDEDLMMRAAGLARRFGLRGYDATHCAAAELLNADDFVAASADAQLLAAWQSLGVTTFDARATPDR